MTTVDMTENKYRRKEEIDMKKTFRSITVALLVLCMVIGLTATALLVQADTAKVGVKTVMQGNDAWLFPKGYDVKSFEQNAKYPEFSYGSTRSETEKIMSVIAERQSIALKIGEAMEKFNSLNGKDSYPYAEYVAGNYIMNDREYGIDAPYLGDGTNKPLKMCIILVKGMEDEAKDLVNYLKGYEDYIVYKYAEHTYYECQSLLDDVIVPAFEDAGIEVTAWGICGTLADAVHIGVGCDYDEYVVKIAEEIAGEYGIAINITFGERWYFE